MLIASTEKNNCLQYQFVSNVVGVNMIKCLRFFLTFFTFCSLWSDSSPRENNLAKKGSLFRLGWPVLCKFQPQSYDCLINDTSVFRFYYDVKMRDCMTFEYFDCVPSYNKFTSLAECHNICRWSGLKTIYSNYTANIYCLFQPEFGDCNSYYPMYYFDISERRCKGFSYSGCGGNRNRFQTPIACKAVCSEAVPYPKHYLFMKDF
ncbi:kunitz-type U19-barytoxin-Tl1a-like [Trichoplusia ni]|uniref:Kunitz-type U19-barytoxin-Tl1a-like n=1 Tax=Trichoplusia ni TaxID=7111 RepID=A0A7E5VHE7_TRINI|nr:kunitz-type U19-barytoxin-Tl1a-like [Trichoplusia ni]